jgi:1-piperideine-2-carboxylate/1-pyrroline-2-carboxylate reductase [NAD(P)H]
VEQKNQRYPVVQGSGNGSSVTDPGDIGAIQTIAVITAIVIVAPVDAIVVVAPVDAIAAFAPLAAAVVVATVAANPAPVLISQTQLEAQMNRPIWLDAAQTAERMPYPALVAALERAAIELAQKQIHCPERLVVPMPTKGSLLCMPAMGPEISCHKLICVMPANKERGLPTILGQLNVLDSQTGECRMILDGATVTGRRTAAMSMLGLRKLAIGPIRKVRIIGTGTQAQTHTQALAALYPGIEVSIKGRTAAAAAAFCRRHAALPLILKADQHPLDRAEQGASAWDGDTGNQAMMPLSAERSADCDVLITCTTSLTPVYAEPARLDRLLIAVGAFHAEAAEIAPSVVQGCEVFVDDPVGARHEAGDLIQAGVDWRAVRAIASILRPQPPTNTLGTLPRLFKTVGCAAWDLAAARVALAH